MISLYFRHSRYFLFTLPGSHPKQNAKFAALFTRIGSFTCTFYTRLSYRELPIDSTNNSETALWTYLSGQCHQQQLSYLSQVLGGRLHEQKENYARSGKWINFLHLFLSSNMPPLRPLTSISCHITTIHVFFGLSCALLTCPDLIRYTHRTGASVGLSRTLPNHHRWFSLIFFCIGDTPILVRISLFLILSLLVLPHIQQNMRISAILIF